MKKTKEKSKKNIGLAIILIMVVIALFIVIRAVVFHKNDIIGYRMFIIMSGSMEPDINLYDCVITKEKDEYNIDDVIAFEEEGNITVHRIIDKSKSENEDKNFYKTKGDANNTEDMWNVNEEEVKGSVVLKIPKLGKIIIFLGKNLPIIGIWIIAIVIVMILIKFIKLQRFKN